MAGELLLYMNCIIKLYKDINVLQGLPKVLSEVLGETAPTSSYDELQNAKPANELLLSHAYISLVNSVCLSYLSRLYFSQECIARI